MIETAKEKGLKDGVEAGKREGRKAATAEAAEHMERIVESAHAYAQRNELCRQFDLFMVENGLRPRDTFTRDYTVTFNETISATSEEQARELVMERLLNNEAYYNFDIEESEE